jgi:ubiquinone/menaquinone biosynthesis C-methylase UbiE
MPMTGPRYTHGHHETVLRSHTWRTAENSAGHLLPHLQPGLSLLDIGCGPGTITVDLARRVAPGQVVGIDPSGEVLERARAEADRAHVEVDFRTGDVFALDLPDASFDIVHAHQVLQHLPDPVGALRAMRRLCAPGGIVAARDADYHGMFWYPRVPELDHWMSVYQQVARGNAAEPDAARHLLGWARAAGFDDVTVTSSTWTYADPDGRGWWGGMWADRVMESAVAEQAVRRGLATRDELRSISDAWRRWAADPDGYFVIVNGEILCRA